MRGFQRFVQSLLMCDNSFYYANFYDFTSAIVWQFQVAFDAIGRLLVDSAEEMPILFLQLFKQERMNNKKVANPRSPYVQSPERFSSLSFIRKTALFYKL